MLSKLQKKNILLGNPISIKENVKELVENGANKIWVGIPLAERERLITLQGVGGFNQI